MTTSTRKQTPAQARKAALESDYAPFYAVAGLTEVVTTSLQAALAEKQREGQPTPRRVAGSGREAGQGRHPARPFAAGAGQGAARDHQSPAGRMAAAG